MKIAFYIGANGSFRDRLVCLTTRSIYSHCELVMEDGLCFSASYRDGGIRAKYIQFDDHWHVYDLASPSQDAERAISYWFSLNYGLKYDLRGAIASLFGIDLTRPDAFYCSWVCASMLGINPIITPGKLFRVLRERKLINA